MNKKIDTALLLSMGATALTIAATLVSAKSNDTQMKKTIKEEVEKAIKNMAETNN